MKTEMIKIDRDDMDLREMKRAGEILKKGLPAEMRTVL